MKSFTAIALIILLAFCLCSFQRGNEVILSPAPVVAGITWSLVHDTTPGSSTSCSPGCTAITIPATCGGGACGGLYVLLVFGIATSDWYISAGNSGYGTWVLPGTTPATACHSYQASTGIVNCAYVLLTSSVTAITLTLSNTGTEVFDIRKYKASSGTVTALTVPNGTTSAGCGTTGSECQAPAVTLGSGGTVLAAAIAVADTGCSVLSPWGHFTSPGGDGAGDYVNATVGTGAKFTQVTTAGNCPSTLASAAASMVSIGFNAQ